MKLKEEIQNLRNRLTAHESNGQTALEAQKSLSSAKTELKNINVEIEKQKSILAKLNSDIAEAQGILAGLQKAIAEKTRAQEQTTDPPETAKESGAESSVAPTPQPSNEAPSERSPKSPEKKQKKTKKSMEAEDVAADAVLIARSASKIGLLPKDTPSQQDESQDRRTERSSTIGGAPAASPKKSKSRVLEKKKKPEDASPAMRRAVTSRKLGGDESPSLLSGTKKRRDSDGALRRAVLLPNRELPIEQLNAYYASHDEAIRKCQAFVRKFNARRRVRRLSSVGASANKPAICFAL